MATVRFPPCSCPAVSPVLFPILSAFLMLPLMSTCLETRGYGLGPVYPRSPPGGEVKRRYLASKGSILADLPELAVQKRVLWFRRHDFAAELLTEAQTLAAALANGSKRPAAADRPRHWSPPQHLVEHFIHAYGKRNDNE